MNNFEGFGLNPVLAQSLLRMNYTVPTPIQAASIPPALQGKDILGSAQTGTGKTAAYAIPLISHLLARPQGKAVVLMPTRELATQVMQVIREMLGASSPVRAALVIGGETMQKQFRQLNAKPRLIVGTPGRINDHLGRRTLQLNDADFLVLDETDRMLDMGFGIQIDRIIAQMAPKRQTLMFSATLPPHIIKLSQKYLNRPERVSMGSVSAPAAKISQEEIRTSVAEKYNVLVEQLGSREGSVIVFVRTKHGADRLAQKLHRADFAAEAIHGDLRQNRRERVIRDFREKKYRILVATDVAARGLDIPHIAHVINYDLPQSPEDYIHRLGRTARAGAEGASLCLLTSEDGGKWHAIQRLINPSEAARQKPASTPHRTARRPRGNNRPFRNSTRARA